MPLPPLVNNAYENFASSNKIYYRVFIVRLCASIVSHTLGVEEIADKKINELNLDFSIKEVLPKELDIKTRRSDVTVAVQCTYKSVVYFVVPFLEDLKKLYIVKSTKTNPSDRNVSRTVLLVSLNFDLNDENIGLPNN